MIPEFWLPYAAIQLCHCNKIPSQKRINEVNFYIYFKWYVYCTLLLTVSMHLTEIISALLSSLLLSTGLEAYILK